MHKILKRLFSVFCILSCLLIVAGCKFGKDNKTPTPEHEHTFTHVDAHPATCLLPGNVEFYRCTTCDKLFDATKTNELTLSQTIIAALGHAMTYVDGASATCEFGGIIAHYHCSNCDKNFEDQAGTKEIAVVTINPLGHTLRYVEAVPATETANGTLAHYHCDVCGKNYEDREATKLLTSIEVTATGHNLTNVPAKAATCTEAGNVAHYHCADCGKNFEDAQGTRLLESVVINALGHTMTKVDKVDATCDHEGTLEHYHCSVCNKDFNDANGTHELTNVVISICGHTLTKVEKVDATCLTAGNLEYYHCSVCNKNFSDVEGKNLLENVVINALGHNATLVAAVPATCAQAGTREHYHCANCNKDFTDAACTIEATDIVIAKLEHVAAEAVTENRVEATCIKAGSYDEVVKCANCGEEISRTTKYIAPLDHDWGEGTNTTPATCLTSGVKTYTCSRCNETKTETIPALGHNYSTQVVNPTCTEKGYTLHTCANCGDSYKDTFVNATGHHWDHDEVTCEQGRLCEICGEEEEALGHNYVLDTTRSTEADCEHAATEVYKCTRCNDEFTNTVGQPLGHSISSNDVQERLVTGSTCIWQQYYECSRCHEEVLGDRIEKHDLVATITTEATCSAAGLKTYTCKNCDHTHTEEIPVNPDAHVWVEGTVTDGKRTDTCSLCGATKVVVIYTGAATAVSDLKGQEIAMDNAAIKLDDSLVDGLGDAEITLAVDTIDDSTKESLGLSAEQLEQVGNNPIYDFSMTKDGDTYSQFGDDNYITITLPYVLQDGEDVDSIAIWYINDQGELEDIEATYSNGTVTFRTNHFSYYTVTRLTPEERCALYGHNYTTKVVEGSCTQDGYTLYVCQRCHETHKENVVEATGHDFVVNEETSTAATCTKNGVTNEVCSKCGQLHRIIVKALGHDYEQVGETVLPTCTEVGYTEYKCSHCEKTYRDTVAALGHTETSTVTEPTCEDYGYTTYKCSICNEERISDLVNPLGHDYTAVFTFAEDHLSASVTLTCANDEDHVVTLDAIVTVEVKDATCAESGDVVYKATLTYGGETYTDQYVEEGIKLPHELGELQHDENGHFYECSVCHEHVDVQEHTFVDEITLAATCGADGKTKHTCSVCGYSYETKIPKTGEHNYVDGVCSVCGKEYATCTHEDHNKELLIDLEDFGCCKGILHILTCDCGEDKIFSQYNTTMTCQYGMNDTTHGTTPDGLEYQSATCAICGLVMYATREEIEDSCVTIERYTYTFIKDGTEIASAYYDIVNEHHDVELKTMEVGTCGSTVEYYQCKDCQKVTDIRLDAEDILCEGEYIIEEDLAIDENTTVNRYTYLCSVCGAKFVEEEIIFEDGCYKRTTDSVYVEYNGEVLLKVSQSEEFIDHDLEYTYILDEGKTCDDEYVAIAKCKDCDYEYRYKTSGHHDSFKKTDTPIIGCNQAVNYYYYECDVCGRTRIDEHLLNELMSICPFGQPETSKTTIDGVEHQISRYTCPRCGLVVELDMFVKSSQCEDNYYVSVKITKDGVIALNTEPAIAHNEDHHNWEVTNYRFMNEEVGCIGGVDVTVKCSVCDKEKTQHIYRHLFETKEITLEVNTCGKLRYQECVICHHIDILEDGHNFATTEEEKVLDDGFTHVIVTHTCRNCGLVWTEDTYLTAPNSHCESFICEKNTVTLGDTVLIADEDYAVVGTTYNHDWDATITFDDPELKCEGGYHYSATCRNCGQRQSYEGHNHEMGEEHQLEITDDNNNVVVIVHYYDDCSICGAKDHHVNFEFVKGSNELFVREETLIEHNGRIYNAEQYTTATLGIKLISAFVEVKEGCYVKTYCYYEVTKGDEVLFTNDSLYSYEQHDFEDEITYLNPDEGCLGGYTITRTCKDCGKVVTEEDKGHRTEYTQIELYEYGIPGYVNLSKCQVCGMIDYVDYQFPIEDLQYTEQPIDPNDSSAGFIKTYTSESKAFTFVHEVRITVDENCLCTENITVSLVIGDDVIFEEQGSRSYQCHNYEYEYTLLGDDCERDGVLVTATCKNCGKVDTHETHSHQMEEFYIPIVNQNDEVVFYLSGYTCKSCGKVIEINYRYYQTFEQSMTYDENYTEVIDGKMYEGMIMTNTDYNVVFSWIWYSEFNYDNPCIRDDYNIIKLIQNDETLFDGLLIQYELEYHTYVDEVEFDDEELKCLGGVTITHKCSVCGDEYTERRSEHYLIREGYIQFTEYGACDGYIDLVRCQYCDFRNDRIREGNHDFIETTNEYDQNGIHYYVNVLECQDCGLRIETRSHYEDLGNCITREYRDSYVSINGTEIYDVVGQRYYDNYNHKYVITGELDEGATSCEDGVTIHYVCSVCGESYDDHYISHYEIPQEVIDLTEFGSVCGGTLTIYECTCGECRHVEVEALGDIHYEWEYYEPTDDDAYAGNGYISIYKCAVTDPLCSFCYAVIDYERFVEDGSCKIEHVYKYLLGYNDQDGSYQRMITVIYSTQNEHHSMISDDIQGEDELGTYTGYVETCSRCGIIETHKNYRDENDNMVYQILTITKDDELLYRDYLEFETFVFGVESFTLAVLEERFDALEEYWYRTEKTYSDPCHYHYVENNSYGDHYEGDELYHYAWHWVERENATCTQEGTYGYVCDVCGEYSGDYLIEPDHHFVYDDEKGLYVCSVCGLENINGASGQIVMEDLSNEDFYRVGYYNKTHVQFLEYVVLMKGEEDFVLEDIYIYQENDNERVVCFGRSDVAWAAEELGLEEGEYEVKFVFVPAGDDGSYDYAITFDGGVHSN